jgi:thiopurine S-methyltransferase
MPLIDTSLLEENIKFWENRYKNNKIEWHINEINPMLLKHLRTLIPTSAEEPKTVSNSKKIFLPLCGKTKDIPFLLSLGLEVFGVESVASAIVELGEENGLDIKFDPINSIYHTADGRLQIYCGDFFTCPIEKFGPFDCVWDRGSFIAIDYPLRELYVDVMKRALNHGTGNLKERC